MRLNRLKITNFRQFSELDVGFNSQLTVLVGNNGSGKSTIIEAASIAVGTLTYAMDGLTNYNINRNDAHYKYFYVGENVDVQPQYPVEIYAEGEIAEQSVKWSRSVKSANGRCTVSNAKELISVAKEYQRKFRSGDTELILPIISYYGTGRLWHQYRDKKNFHAEKTNRTNGYVDCMDGAANDKLMKQWFQKMTIKSLQNKKQNGEFLAVCKAVSKCFSLITGSDDVHLEYNLDTTEIDIYYRNDSFEKVVMPLSKLSDGYRCTISLITDIAYRMAVLNPQLGEDVLTETDGIVLIDEVDLHLHPSWQSRVLSDLCTIFPKVQFIVTTHSPSVLANVRKEHICILENGKANHCTNNTYGRKADAILQEIMTAEIRPKEIGDLIDLVNKAVDKHDIASAKKQLSKLKDILGENDEAVIDAQTCIEFEEL